MLTNVSKFIFSRQVLFYLASPLKPKRENGNFPLVKSKWNIEYCYITISEAFHLARRHNDEFAQIFHHFLIFLAPCKECENIFDLSGEQLLHKKNGASFPLGILSAHPLWHFFQEFSYQLTKIRAHIKRLTYKFNFHWYGVLFINVVYLF